MDTVKARNKWRRWTRTAVLATFIVALSLLGAAPAKADGLATLTHFYDPGDVVPSTIVCAPGGLAIHGNATFGTEAGDKWIGTTSYDYCIYPQSEGWYIFVGTETLTGTVEGCGTGTMTWDQAGTFQVGTDNGGGVWRIVSGTGALAGITGKGISKTFVSPALENFGYFAGTTQC
jgi:hypothetical protein